MIRPDGLYVCHFLRVIVKTGGLCKTHYPSETTLEEDIWWVCLVRFE